MFAWAERDDRARVVIDDDLHVSWYNAAALKLVPETRLFDWSQGRLSPKDGRWASAFRVFIQGSGPTSTTLCIPSPSDEHVLCTALNVGSARPGHMTGLTLRCAGRSVPLDGRALETLFHLTGAERRVVEALFAGRTAEEVGSQLSVSVGTVRVHIRRIYEKVNVCSREAMFHKLFPYMSPL